MGTIIQTPRSTGLPQDQKTEVTSEEINKRTNSGERRECPVHADEILLRTVTILFDGQHADKMYKSMTIQIRRFRHAIGRVLRSKRNKDIPIVQAYRRRVGNGPRYYCEIVPILNVVLANLLFTSCWCAASSRDARSSEHALKQTKQTSAWVNGVTFVYGG